MDEESILESFFLFFLIWSYFPRCGFDGTVVDEATPFLACIRPISNLDLAVSKVNQDPILRSWVTYNATRSLVSFGSRNILFYFE
jgi:hypothetical protein